MAKKNLDLSNTPIFDDDQSITDMTRNVTAIPQYIGQRLKENKRERLLNRGAGNWSPDNPYASQMMYARNRQDIDALKQQAIEWEANQQQYQQQLDDQERLSDPHYQLARQRAAGINPDIAGGSGSSGAGATVSPPAMADTELTEMSSVYKTSDRVFTGMQSAASLISAVSGSMLQGTEFVKNVATFGDMLSMSDSSKRAARASADVAEQTVQPQVQRIQQLAAGGHLELYGQIAESLPDSKDPHTEQSIAKHLESLGIDPSHAKGVYSYTQSPSQQQLRSDQRVKAVKARALEAAAGYDHYLRVEHNQAAFREAKSLSDAQLASFEQMVASWAYTPEDASVESDIIKQGRESYILETSLSVDKLKNDIDAFKQSMEMRRQQILKLNDLIDQYSSSESPTAQAIVSASMLFRTQLYSLTSEEFYRLSAIGNDINRMEFIADIASLHNLDNKVPIGWQALNQHLINFYDLALPQDWANNPEPATKVLDKVFEAMLTAARKSPKGRALSGAAKIAVK